MTEVLKFKAGSAIAFTSGEYSDFSNCGVVILLKDCDLPALAQECVRDHKPRDTWDSVCPTDFPTWLITHGYAMAADVQEVHLGSYGRFEPEFGVTSP